ncbi:Histone acetyltransferase [Rhizina undulata]
MADTVAEREDENGPPLPAETSITTPKRRGVSGWGSRGKQVEDEEQSDDGEDGEAEVAKRDIRPSPHSRREARSSVSCEDENENENEEDEDEDEQEEGEDWQDEEDADDEETKGKSLCIHCQQDESCDPSEEFEDPLECVACNAFSHFLCDQNANDSGGVKSSFDEETSQWRCPNCAAAGVESTDQPTQPNTPEERRSRPASSKEDAPRSLRRRKSSGTNEEDSNTMSTRRGTLNKRLDANPAHSSSENDEAASESASDEDVRQTNPTRRKLRFHGALAGGKRMHVTYASSPSTNELLVKIKGIDPAQLQKIVSAPPNPSNPTSHRRNQRARSTTENLGTPRPSTFPSTTSPTPLYTEQEAEQIKPYGGLITGPDADTSKTVPGANERLRFDKAKDQADKELKMRLMLTSANEPKPNSNGMRRMGEAERAAQGASKIECIHFGEFEIDTWYAAPYPEEYSKNRVLWICEFCLKYMNSEYVGWRHKLKCDTKHPPGNEIYRDGTISIFEIDGRKNPVYCQNLCLLAKLFLGSKTLYYDVEPFLFYVMTERDEKGMHFVGYFSKEKRSSSQNNVSCILTLPIHQRKGYGNLLIAFSYLLTRVEGKTGSPEKPFSDLGLVSYRNYWKLTLCYELLKQHEPLSVGDISRRTGMTSDDVICGLEALHALVRDPVTGVYAFRLDRKAYRAHIARWEAKNYVNLNPNALVWTAFILGRSQAAQLNDAPVQTIAPRPGEYSNEPEMDGDTEMADAEAAEAGAGAADDEKKSNGAPNGTNGTNETNGHFQVLEEGEMHSAARTHEDVGMTNGIADLSSVMPGVAPKSNPTQPGSEQPSPATKKTSSGILWKDPSDVAELSDSELVELSRLHHHPGIPPTRFEIVPQQPGATSSRRSRGGMSSANSRAKKRATLPFTPRTRVADTPRPTTTTRRARSKMADSFTANGSPDVAQEQSRETRDSSAISSGAAIPLATIHPTAAATPRSMGQATGAGVQVPATGSVLATNASPGENPAATTSESVVTSDV